MDPQRLKFIVEAALLMMTVAESGAGFSGCSAIHMNIFGLHPVVVFGTEAQKARFLPPLIAGRDRGCFTRHNARCSAQREATGPPRLCDADVPCEPSRSP